MIIETMPLKTITPENHLVDFDGYVYTKPNEIYNENTYVRPSSILPFRGNYVFPNKVNLGSITVSCNEGLPQFVKFSDDTINMKPLQEYDYITAIPFDITTINKNISATRSQYSTEFLSAVQSC